VELTQEQKLLVPDWEEQKELFQRRCDKHDLRERFRIVLHEGGHALQFRRLWDVKFHGPHIRYEDGKLHFVLGAVSPSNNYEPFQWQHAMVSTAGFWTVEHFTAVPDEQFIIQNDLQGLRSKLGENEDMNQAVAYAEIMLEDQLSNPTFISQLEQACRDYEMSVYGNTKATEWGWREYRPEISGKRHRVAVTTSGYFGTLVVDGDDLILLTEGGLFRPEDELRNVRLEIRIAEPQKAGTQRVVQAWNEAAGQMFDEQKVDEMKTIETQEQKTSNDYAERKKWTELETAFLREQSNRDFRKWWESHQGTSKQTSQP
jgi:hypothetical protein